MAWCCGTTSGFFLAGTLIQGVIVELHSDYASEPWRGYLFVFVLTTIGALVNTYLSRKLRQLEEIAFILTIAGFVTVVIVLLVLSSPQRFTAAEVFQSFSNEGGWSSLGLSMVAGQVLLVWALTGSDATAHMAEETAHASSVIPNAMIWSYLINGLLVFIMLITYCFCLIDLTAAFDSPTGFPFIQVFATATGSRQGGVGLTCILIVLILFSVTNYMASCSRQVFDFARDRGFSFHSWISKVCYKASRSTMTDRHLVTSRSIATPTALSEPSSSVSALLSPLTLLPAFSCSLWSSPICSLLAVSYGDVYTAGNFPAETGRLVA